MAQAGAYGAGAIAKLAGGFVRANALRLDGMSAEQIGQTRAKRIRTAGAAELSKSRADAVGAGIRVGVGSAAEAERSVIRNYEQDAAVAILSGRNQARSLDLEADRVKTAAIGESLAHGFAAYDKWRRSKYVQPTSTYAAGADYWPQVDAREY